MVASNGDLVVAGLTLSHGASGATIAGTVISLGANGLIIGTSTFAVPTPASTLTLPLIGGQKVSVGSKGDVVIAGTTILPGKARVIVLGTSVSLGSNGLVIGASTYAGPAAPHATTLPLIRGQPVQQAGDDGVSLYGTTLAPGIQLSLAHSYLSVPQT